MRVIGVALRGVAIAEARGRKMPFWEKLKGP